MNALGLHEFLLISAWSVFAVWLTALLRTQYCLKNQAVLGLQTGLAEEPFVSILVPARNEANRVLEKSISSMLDQNYKNYELIVVDDRSTDQTCEILEKIRSEISNPKLRIIHGAELPGDWLGKPHALRQAFLESTGEWILTTDADIVFAPETLPTVVAYAAKYGFEVLSLMPKQQCASFWETLFTPVFIWLCLLIRPLHRVNDPGSRVSLGVGNFFMMRRTVLEKIGDFEAVRNEVAEDLKLAEIIKKKGFKLRVEYAPELIETRMYAGFGEVWEGFTKNFFSGLNFSLAKTMSGAFWVLLLGVLPVFLGSASLTAGDFALAFPLMAAYFLQVLTFLKMRLYLRLNGFYALLTPLGFGLFLAILLNSTVKILSGKGVVWKGRVIYQAGGVRPPPD